MNDDVLLALSYKTERAASRRLMVGGLSASEALRRTLTISAGRQGLAALLAERAALQQHVALRAAARVAAQAQAQRQIARSALPAGATPWQAWFDGSAHPNPGRCGIGALLQGPDGQHVELAQAAGHGNSSEAEYRALIALLQTAVAHGAAGLTVHGDSRVVLDDVVLPAPLAAPSLQALHASARALIEQLEQRGAVRLRWIPRHKNGAADALSQRASAMHKETLDNGTHPTETDDGD